MKTHKKSILVVDDEIKIADVVKSYLENKGFTVYIANTGKKALELFEALIHISRTSGKK